MTAATTLKTKPEYEHLVTPLPKDVYDALKDSIKTKGQFLPIVVNQDDIILDGHHRVKICQELGIEPLIERVSFTPVEELDYVVSVNVNRRQLNPIEAAIIAKRRYGYILGEGFGGGRREEDVASSFGMSKGTFHRALQVVLHHGEEKALQKSRGDAFSFNEEYERIMHEQDAIARAAALKDAPVTTSKLYLVEGGFEEPRIPDNSIDAIITDPPYPRGYLSLFGDLAKWAAKKLKEGGSLLVLSGQYYLPTVFELLNGGRDLGLEYYWTIAYLTPGGTGLIEGRAIQCGWKPVIWLMKRKMTKYEPEWIRLRPLPDVVKSVKAEKSDGKIAVKVEGADSTDKSRSQWQQSVSGFEALIERCTRPGDMVLDPMMGSGTTGEAALRLKRRFIGIEKDAGEYKVAANRIHQVEAEMRRAKC